MSESAVNRAYAGKMKRLLVFDNLGTGIRNDFTSAFDTAFTEAMQRCSVSTAIIDADPIELNPRQRILATVNTFRPDTTLTAVWTTREADRYGPTQQNSLFTMTQVPYEGHPSTYIGEVWKASITNSLVSLAMGDKNGTVLANKAAEQMQKDGIVQGCTLAPPQPPS